MNLWENSVEAEMCEHLDQAATETMGRDLEPTVDWSARFGRNQAIIGERFAESCLQANTARGAGREGSRRRNSLMQRQLTHMDWAAFLLKSKQAHQDFFEEARRQRTTGPASPAEG